MKSSKAAKKSAPGKKPKSAAKKAVTKLISKVKKAVTAKKPAKAAKPEPKAKAGKPEPKKIEAKKKVLTNPFETFMQFWKPKAENFEAGLDKLLAEYPPPDKNIELYKQGIVEKIHAHMRKEPLTSVIEEQLMERFQRDRVHKMASIWNMKPRLTIRINTLKADIKGFGGSEAAKELKIRRTALSPWSYEIGKPEAAFTSPAYERGVFEFQDEASQIVSLFVNARAGQRILDLAAGDGSNALALSAMMRNKGSIFIYETDARKLRSFKEKAQRAGVENFRILTDSQISEVKSLDSVLVHAPSSRIGELGLHPDLRWRVSKEELPRVQKLQAALIREGARKLKLRGYLIYATSTLNKSENEAQIEHFLRTSHNSYRLVPAFSYFKEWVVPYVRNFYGFEIDEKTLAGLAEHDPFFMLLPDIHNTSGTFIAVLQRTRIST